MYKHLEHLHNTYKMITIKREVNSSEVYQEHKQFFHSVFVSRCTYRLVKRQVYTNYALLNKHLCTNYINVVISYLCII